MQFGSFEVVCSLVEIVYVNPVSQKGVRRAGGSFFGTKQTDLVMTLACVRVAKAPRLQSAEPLSCFDLIEPRSDLVVLLIVL